jgi:hypothetical protein
MNLTRHGRDPAHPSTPSPLRIAIHGDGRASTQAAPCSSRLPRMTGDRLRLARAIPCPLKETGKWEEYTTEDASIVADTRSRTSGCQVIDNATHYQYWAFTAPAVRHYRHDGARGHRRQLDRLCRNDGIPQLRRRRARHRSRPATRHRLSGRHEPIFGDRPVCSGYPVRASGYHPVSAAAVVYTAGIAS